MDKRSVVSNMKRQLGEYNATGEEVEMSYPIDDLNPKPVWRYFDKIRQIPRGSGNEQAVGDALIEWAKAAGATGKKDAVGNVLISVPASRGLEGSPALVLQTHMDMVCEQDKDRGFDFAEDAIVLRRDGDWISADRTTLGADNGIGLASAMALLDEPDLSHGPLEILSTVEEETGLKGASALDPGFVSGKLLFNLDSEDDGRFCVGCAGGLDTLTTLVTERVPVNKAMIPFELRVSGLSGGHSGVDIHLNRANAVVAAARTLRALIAEAEIAVSWIVGGDKHNAIPREAFATILVSPSNEAKMFEIVAEGERLLKEEFGAAEPGIREEAVPTGLPAGVLSAASAKRLIDMIYAFPSGVLSLVRDIPGVVETSNNPARIRCDERQVTILNSSRSSVRAAVLGVESKIRAVAEAAGATTAVLSDYPGWKPNFSSALLKRAEAIWRRVHGDAPKIEVIHAGLECGIIGEKLPGMDMISLGPTIENPHSPAERVSISSVERFYSFLKAFVEDVSGGA